MFGCLEKQKRKGSADKLLGKIHCSFPILTVKNKNTLKEKLAVTEDL